MTKLHIEKDYLVFENIGCPSDGISSDRLFEFHKVLYVPRDIFRDAEKSPLLMNARQASVYCEQQGQFQPSFALTCNILTSVICRIYNSNEPRLREFLDQYKTAGLHLQNTEVDFDRGLMIHNPQLKNSYGVEFLVYQFDKNNSLYQRIELPFEKEKVIFNLLRRCLPKTSLQSLMLRSRTLQSRALEVDIPFLTARFLIPLTGLGEMEILNPRNLFEVGHYFAETNPGDRFGYPSLLVPKKLSGTYATALGCDPVSGCFSLHVDIPLDTALAVRGAKDRVDLERKVE